MKKYFDEQRFNYIRKLVNGNYLEIALLECEKYLVEYSNDCYCKAYYSEILIKLGMFQEAEEIINDIFITNKTPELSKQFLILIKLRLLNCKNDYEECLKILRENYEVFENRDWRPHELLIYFKKKLNLLADVDYSGYSYKIDQIVSYNEHRTIECIKKCHTIIEDDIPPRHFFDDFPVEEVFNQIKNMLPLDTIIYQFIIENIYIFKYDNCGKINNRVVDYIKVITLNDSNNILTMLPYENKEKSAYIDITPIKKEEKAKFIKRLSQVEKFNKKYKID